MLTQDYLNGYLAARKTVQENIDNRLDFLKKNDLGFEYQQETVPRVIELTAIKLHIEQVKESYRQLVKELNEKHAKSKTTR